MDLTTRSHAYTPFDLRHTFILRPDNRRYEPIMRTVVAAYYSIVYLRTNRRVVPIVHTVVTRNSGRRLWRGSEIYCELVRQLSTPR